MIYQILFSFLDILNLITSSQRELDGKGLLFLPLNALCLY